MAFWLAACLLLLLFFWLLLMPLSALLLVQHYEYWNIYPGQSCIRFYWHVISPACINKYHGKQNNAGI
jgi:hypothetical protein